MITNNWNNTYKNKQNAFFYQELRYQWEIDGVW